VRTVGRLALGIVCCAVTIGVGTGAGRGSEDPTSGVAVIVKPDPRAVREGFVANQVLVKLRPGVGRGALTRGIGGVEALRTERIAGTAVRLVRLPGDVSVGSAVRRYEGSGRVAFAEPNWYRRPALIPDDPHFGWLWGLHNVGQEHPLADHPSAMRSGTIDADIDAPAAWDAETGEPSAVIAIIDSGTDVTHPDLDGNIWVNGDEIPANGIDDDDNGYVDDVNGWDFAEDDAGLLGPSNALGWDHGTHVAGTAAAETNNAVGVAGVCGGNGAAPGCSLMVLKFMDVEVFDGSREMVGTTATELAAIDYAIEEGADVINASFTSYQFSLAERSALQRAQRAGILTVAAAGNDSLDNDVAQGRDFDGDGKPDAFSPSYPAGYRLAGIVSVAAGNHRDEYAYGTFCAERNTRDQCAFTNWGRFSVDLAAPGVDVTSTVPGGGYDTWSGASMATPHVAGVAGLLLSADPTLAPAEVKAKVLNGAETGIPLSERLRTSLFPSPGLPTQQSATSSRFTETAGRLDAAGAFAASAVRPVPVHDGDVPGALTVRRTRQGRVAWPADANDLFRTHLRRNHRYRITLSVPAGRDYDLYVWKPGTVEVWQFQKFARGAFHDIGIDEALTFRPRTTGTFFVHVASWFSTGPYTLRIRCLDC